VPLIYAVAWQLFRNHLASLLAALLLAVAPLHVWYGQEVRMYTLLTFLCLLSSYLLLLATGSEKRWQVIGLWTGFTLTSIAALYTHYFAVLILAFQAGYLLLLWWGRGFHPRRLVFGGLASGVIIAIAYLPWLPHLLTRYGADASYWPGQLKLHEIVIDIAVFFVGGESVSESTGIILAVGFTLVFGLCFLALLLQAASQTSTANPVSYLLPPSYYSLLFLLLYLLLPPILILALSYNSPKFNARYIMMSHPALLLTLAGGMAALWQRKADHLSNVARGTLSTLALVFVLCASAYANYNAYTNPAFARADFRGVTRYVRKQIAPDETIILTSGHMFPVFDYYAAGTERHLLPDSPTLDTTRTLDYSIASDLNDWLADKGGVWLVLWQDQVVDPAGYLTSMMDEAGQEQVVDKTFTQVRLKHYRLPENSVFSDQPTIAHPTDFNFDNRLHLLGYTQTGERQVTLFWEALQTLDEDYRVSLVLRDTLGQGWGQWDGRPTAYFHPTDRWEVGEVVFGRYDLSLVPGAPPGDYGLEVGVYTEDDPIGLDVLDSAGAPQGKRAMLGAVRLSVAAASPEEISDDYVEKRDLGGGLALLGWELGRDEAQPGDRLQLTLLWSVESKPQGNYQVLLLVTDAAGQILHVGTLPPTNIWHPTSTWLPGQAWRGQMTFRLPIQAQPGEARLAIQLLDAAGSALGMPSDLSTFSVSPTTRVFAPPKPQAPRRTNFGDEITLLGADLTPVPVSPGGVLRVTLYWQALDEMDIPYTVFVHLLGSDGGVVVGQDSEPAFGARPTTSWVPGEYISDPHELSVPSDLPPGEYVVEVGLYDAGARGMPRLPVLGDGGEVETDRVIFAVQVR
jgi:hypothetical protein